MSNPESAGVRVEAGSAIPYSQGASEARPYSSGRALGPTEAEPGACFVSSAILDPEGLPVPGLSGVILSPLPPAAAGDCVWNRFVPVDQIPGQYLEFVGQHVRRAGQLLEMGGPITVKFFLPVIPGTVIDETLDYPFVIDQPGEEVAGFALTRWQNTFGIHAGLRGGFVAGVVSHEMAHLRQNRRYGLSSRGMSIVDRERDAAAFMLEYMRAPRLVA